MRLATSCWLLVALAATTALAQTHPKRLVRKHTVGRRLGSGSVKAQYPARGYDEEEPPPPTPKLMYPCPSPEPEVIEVIDANQVYTYVEQMPTLGGQGGVAAIITAIQQHLVLPPAAPAGRAFVQFVVSKAGVVTKPQIVKGLRADVDSAVVAATRQLPRLTPGSQNGWAVPVRITLLVPIAGQQP